MVRNTFLQEFAEFARKIEGSKGPFTLAMLVPGESGLPDKWNLVVSAKWIDGKGLEPAIPTITSAMLKYVSKENVRKIERVSPLSTADSITRDIVEEIQVIPDTARRVHLFALTARGIDGGIILAARNSVALSSRQPQPVRLRG
jgi:hypothetical protein